jgi:hypothetical protein
VPVDVGFEAPTRCLVVVGEAVRGPGTEGGWIYAHVDITNPAFGAALRAVWGEQA